MTFLLSKSPVGFFSGPSKECASTRLDINLCMQNNGFGKSHPKAAAPYIMVLLECRVAAKVSIWKLEREAPRTG